MITTLISLLPYVGMAREGQIFQTGVHGLTTRIASLFTLDYELCLVSNAAIIGISRLHLGRVGQSWGYVRAYGDQSTK